MNQTSTYLWGNEWHVGIICQPKYLDGTTSVTGGSTSYATSFDAAGHMTARNGQALAYDNQGRQLSWTDATPSTNTSSYAYDGEGHRVAQSTTVSGTITTTVYLLGGIQEVATTGEVTTTTVYYQAVAATAIAVNGGALMYVISDTNGSIVRGIAANGTAAGMRLYTPYGVPTVNQPGIPTNHGYQGGYTDQAGLVAHGTTAHDTQAGQSTQVGGGGSQRNGGDGAASSGNGGNTGSGNSAPQSNPNVGGTNPVAQSAGATNTNTQTQTGGCVGCKVATIGDNTDINYTWNHDAVVNELKYTLWGFTALFLANAKSYVQTKVNLTPSLTHNQRGYLEADIILWNNEAHTQGWIWDMKSIGQSKGPGKINDQMKGYIVQAATLGISLSPASWYMAGNLSGNYMPMGAHIVNPPPDSPVTYDRNTQDLVAWKAPIDGIVYYDLINKPQDPSPYDVPVFAPNFNPWKQWQWNPWIPRQNPPQGVSWGEAIAAGIAAIAVVASLGGGCRGYNCTVDR